MRGTYITSTLALLLAAFLTAGCAGFSDLKKARDRGVIREFVLSQEEAFEKVLKILKDNKLTTYRKSPEKGYIIVMGFERQTDTTRVGIFFEKQETNKTAITLSSLSRSVLGKAETIIFGGLEKTCEPSGL